MTENNREMNTYPLIPLRGVAVFPGTVTTLDIARDFSAAAVDAAWNGDRKVFVVTQRDSMEDKPELTDLYTVGTVAVIRQCMPMPDHSVRILLQGETRGILLNLRRGDMFEATAAIQTGELDIRPDDPETRAYMRTITRLARTLMQAKNASSPDFLAAIEGERMPGMLCDAVANVLLESVEIKQQVLETFDVNLRLELPASLLGQEINLVRLQEKIEARVHEAMDRANHEYYLREQIHAIQDELGEDEDEEIVEYRRQLKKTDLPADARDKVEREIRRLSRTAPQSPESSVSQNYIETMLELPWGKKDSTEIDINRARRILEADHYGLKEVKTRLIEYLAVRKTTGAIRSPILCLVGAPGVGKTSIAKSVARALNRKFTQMSLGGVHDEAEIRGHRKTYVGAMPGRIVSSLQRCGTMNPVFLLDEIDKISHDLRGDPASALLEALDPQQNQNFRDHYLETSMDLSDVLFITTANSTEPIDRALLDRMEVIEVPSYTLDEKCKIAKRYLLPRQLEAHGLKKGQVRISEKTMADLVDFYTREAGVRNLERAIEKVCRKAALECIENPEIRQITLKTADLGKYLGAKKYLRQETAKKPKIGVVNGLAWTSVGGEVMPVEAVAVDGKGTLELTGSLGDVMQESAKLAKTLTRTHAAAY